MSNFGALVEGLITVRAFNAQPRFQARVIEVVDNFQKNDHFYWSLQAWLSFRFSTMSASATLVMTLIAVYTGITPGLTAFVLITASRFVMYTEYMCRIYGQLEMQFTSVERVIELLDLDQEAPGVVDPPATGQHIRATSPSRTPQSATRRTSIPHCRTLHSPSRREATLRSLAARGPANQPSRSHCSPPSLQKAAAS